MPEFGRPGTERGPGSRPGSFAVVRARDAGSAPWPEIASALRGDTSPELWRAVMRRLARDPDAWAAVRARRTIRIAVAASHTTGLLTRLLPVAGLACGVEVNVEPVPFGQLETWLLDPAADRSSPLDYVVLWGTHHDLQLGSAPFDCVVEAAVERWTGLWDLCRRESGARVIQLLFVPPPHDAFGSIASSVADSDSSVVARINSELVSRAGDGAGVLFVDCVRLAAETGWRQWHDERHWDMFQVPVAPPAVPVLARSLAGVLAADLGLSRRCLVVDLDNTLWGGVLGEEGVNGVDTGGAFQRFQEYLIGLRRRGVVLAVASKNDLGLVEEALEAVPGLRLRRGDFAAVVADWRPKSEQLTAIAARLNLGIASLALVDDNPAECAEVAAHLPDVDVICLPPDPTFYVDALYGRPTLQAAPPTGADISRAASYAAVAEADSLLLSSDSLADFLDSLRMRVQVRPLGSDDLERAAQLIQKTNQFNLTARRHSRQHLLDLTQDPGWRCFVLRLRDRFADHGLVGLILARISENVAEIDTLLLSCRVIGRTAERRLVSVVAEEARSAGCSVLVGTYVATERNTLVADLYPTLGFQLDERGSRAPVEFRYVYPLDVPGPDDSSHFGSAT